jgi:hypothetical protein
MAQRFEVRQSGSRWKVRLADGTQVSCHGTQQQAIDAAKARAHSVSGRVIWRDGSGTVQGQASYEVRR